MVKNKTPNVPTPPQIKVAKPSPNPDKATSPANVKTTFGVPKNTK